MSDSVYGLIDVSEVPKKGNGSWDEEVDIVVCGLGAAGVSVAVESGLHGSYRDPVVFGIRHPVGYVVRHSESLT